MRPDIQQELSYTLLTELLAYQFASPVRWIETQEVFLKEYNTERVVEIGPSPTLAGMASKTIKAKYESYDSALTLERLVLCYATDMKEIYYISQSEKSGETDEFDSSSAEPILIVPTEVPPVPAIPTVAVVNITDEPVKAAMVVHVLVAQKLKKLLESVPMTKTIKELVNGKSTVQNEIVGDLGKEFGTLPEKPEDCPLEDLAEGLEENFAGMLGKTTTSLVSRLMSSKMPGGYSMTVARKYLETRFGLGSGRQDAVLLMALIEEPSARLNSEVEAKTFFDSVATKYASSAGVSLISPSSANTSGQTDIIVDSAALNLLNTESKTLARQQLEVLARYLSLDWTKDTREFHKEKGMSSKLQIELDLWHDEHGDVYAKGIEPVFSLLKARVYDSAWNWVRQDVMMMYYDVVLGKSSMNFTEMSLQIMNRASPDLVKLIQYRIDNTPEESETHQLAQYLEMKMIDQYNGAPVFKDVTSIIGPRTTIDERGSILYEEIQKDGMNGFEDYVYEMAQGGDLIKSDTGNTKLDHSILEMLAHIHNAISKQVSTTTGNEFDKLYQTFVECATDQRREVEIDTTVKPSDISTTLVSSTISPSTLPFLHIQSKCASGWKYDYKLSCMFLDGLQTIASDGISFTNMSVLITGASAGSIAERVLQGLISGGAQVIVTTSHFSKDVTNYYQDMYTKYGASGSKLVVVPFNQGSKQDVDSLISYIYDSKGLGWDLDAIIPFAAIPANENGLDNIDSKSELAHRIMLTNLLRLLGAVKTRKDCNTRPAQVILPLFPNYGKFGFDGLYSESKIGLETLFNRWYSEDWRTELTICGAMIGWTRGTDIMSDKNIIAEGIEKMGVRTFSPKEMAFNILGLLTPQMIKLCQEQPVVADLNGGLQFIDNIKFLTTQLRQNLIGDAVVRRAVSLESALEHNLLYEECEPRKTVQPRANMLFSFPELKPYQEIKKVAPQLEGMLDLESIIVVTGFAEVGPWGNSRTRWEMEAFGEFSLEGCIEMAWIMGLIKYHNGNLKGTPYSGWIDSNTMEPVNDMDIKSNYEEYILNHAGIRLIEPDLFDGYNPEKKQLIQEVMIQHDLEPFEASKELAEQYKHQHGDKCDIFEIEESGEYSVHILKGAVLFVPKALRFDRLVAGQIPTGWNAKTYGISEDTIAQVDPITLYVLVSTAEALIVSGITDPYEFYKYVHVSEVGNCSGSGMGGVTSLRGMFKDRYEDKPIQNDIFAESYINTMSAWVNMMLLSSSGPIKTPVGACATSIESVDIGIETILSGKAKICIVGGCDDFQEEGSYEFANMGATSSAVEEFAHGRAPSEMSRPCTSTRNGFMESQGSGSQVIMTADLAIKMGVPVYAIIAMTATATDKIGKSIPAPGKGILTTAREYQLKYPSAVLDINYRKRQLKKRLNEINSWKESEIKNIVEEAEVAICECSQFSVSDFMIQREDEIDQHSRNQIAEAKKQWGNFFHVRDARISPLRGALATFDLTIDDIAVASFHGTSTMANDENEAATINLMMKHLGRSEGNPVFGVFQKFLTGHPKGAAGAWMLNGAIQILNSGLVPGNRNADNIDKSLEKFNLVLFPSKSIQTDGIKAVSVTSFGFGQKGAQAVVVHPNYLFAILDKATYEDYVERATTRNRQMYRYMHNSITRNTMFRMKENPPYNEDLEEPVYLNPLARVEDSKAGLVFTSKGVQYANNI